MRYVYGITAALLLGGTAATLTMNPAGAQVAQNEPGAMAATAPRPGAPMSFADLVARLQPAVVNISTEQSITVPSQRQLPPGFEEFFRRFGQTPPDSGAGPQTRRGGSLGSGFIISPDGYIVTNNHVVAPARPDAVVEQITVTLNDRTEYQAEVVGRDAASDIAVLRIRPRGALPFVRLGDSRQTRVGDWVVAIGNPFSLGGTVTAGIVSAVHRNINSGQYDRYIQTDASINSGNSGGPMFDLQGNVIGINTALISPTGGNVGIGFAIPSEQAAPVIEALRRGERVQRGYIGISIQQIDADLAAGLGIERNRGELIGTVQPGGAAARAGIQQGDVILSVAGQPVTPDQSLATLIAQQRIGARVPLEVLRNGQRRNITVEVGQRPTDEELARLAQPEGAEENLLEENKPEDQQSAGQRSARESLGMTVQTLTPAIARQLGVTGVPIQAVVVSSVDPSSDAAAKGIQPGDIILSINQRATPTPEAAAAIVAEARRANRTAVAVLVRRGPITRYVGIELSAAR